VLNSVVVIPGLRAGTCTCAVLRGSLLTVSLCWLSGMEGRLLLLLLTATALLTNSSINVAAYYKMLSCHTETVRLLPGVVLAKI